MPGNETATAVMFFVAVPGLAGAPGPSELKAQLQLPTSGCRDLYSQRSRHGSGSVVYTSQEAGCAESLRNPGHRFELKLLIPTSRQLEKTS